MDARLRWGSRRGSGASNHPVARERARVIRAGDREHLYDCNAEFPGQATVVPVTSRRPHRHYPPRADRANSDPARHQWHQAGPIPRAVTWLMRIAGQSGLECPGEPARADPRQGSSREIGDAGAGQAGTVPDRGHRASGCRARLECPGGADVGGPGGERAGNDERDHGRSALISRVNWAAAPATALARSARRGNQLSASIIEVGTGVRMGQAKGEGESIQARSVVRGSRDRFRRSVGPYRTRSAPFLRGIAVRAIGPFEHPALTRGHVLGACRDNPHYQRQAGNPPRAEGI